MSQDVAPVPEPVPLTLTSEIVAPDGIDEVSHSTTDKKQRIGEYATTYLVYSALPLSETIPLDTASPHMELLSSVNW